MRTVFRWVKAFKAGKFSVEDDTHPGRPKTKANIAAVKIVVKQDARLSVKDIDSCTGISEGSVQTILKRRLDLRKVCATCRWVPHLLTEEQKTQRLKCAWELLKTYKGCNNRVVSNLLTGDETWVHMFEPQRRADNKQWKWKDQKRPCIAKRIVSLKTMLYTIFFNSSGPVVQVPCPSGLTVTGRFYKNSVLKKVKEFYNKKRPSKGWSGVHLLHDNASSHKCEVVKSFLASEKVKVLNHPPYSPDLSPCYFFLFPRLKKMLSGNKYMSRSSLGSAGFALGFLFLSPPFSPIWLFFVPFSLTLSQILSQILAIFRQRIISSEKKVFITDSFNCSNRFKSQYNVNCVGDLKVILALIFKTFAVIN